MECEVLDRTRGTLRGVSGLQRLVPNKADAPLVPLFMVGRDKREDHVAEATESTVGNLRYLHSDVG
jgi:hypothetical protein